MTVKAHWTNAERREWAKIERREWLIKRIMWDITTLMMIAIIAHIATHWNLSFSMGALLAGSAAMLFGVTLVLTVIRWRKPL